MAEHIYTDEEVKRLQEERDAAVFSLNFARNRIKELEQEVNSLKRKYDGVLGECIYLKEQMAGK